MKARDQISTGYENLRIRSASVAGVFGACGHGTRLTLSKAVEQDLVWVATKIGFCAIA